MNAVDSARLELLRRAYQAAQPRSAEVQAGVRRARLALRRTGRARSFFGKALIGLVLAIGGLAYAKPQALGDWVGRPFTNAPARGAGVASPSRASDERQLPSTKARKTTAPAAPSRVESGESNTPIAPSSIVPSSSAPPRSAPRSTPRKSSAALGEHSQASDWGRVGQALAQGDEASALSALGALAQSDDPRTRDKADLGRAQLLLARGQQSEACALARSLTQRQAGSHIERQARALLTSCAR